MSALKTRVPARLTVKPSLAASFALPVAWKSAARSQAAFVSNASTIFQDSLSFAEDWFHSTHAPSARAVAAGEQAERDEQ